MSPRSWICSQFWAGASFQLFWGPQIFYIFSMSPDYWKIGKKQHFICSNLTLFIIPFFLSFFSSFFLFFLFFLSFFLFPWGATAPQPTSNDAPDSGGWTENPKGTQVRNRNLVSHSWKFPGTGIHILPGKIDCFILTEMWHGHCQTVVTSVVLFLC